MLSSYVRTIKDLPIGAKLLLAFLIVGVLPFVFYFPIELSGDWLRPTFGIDVHLFTLGIRIILSLVMALLFARLFTRPLHLLDKTAREILSGADKQIQIDTKDEIGQVARTFDLLLTNQKRRMREQGESEKRLRYLVEKMGEGVIVADRDETITFVNDKMCEILGYESNELIGRAIYEFLNETNKAILREKTVNRMKGLSEKYDLQFIPKSGDLVSTIVSAAPLYSDDDSYVGSFAVVMDVTERKRAEEAIQKLSYQNKLILDSLGEGVYGVDVSGKATFVNPAAAVMLGYTIEELVCQPMHEILHHSKRDGTPYPREECPIYAAFKDGVEHSVIDELFWKKDGTSFPVEYVSTPIRERSELIGAVVVFKDITERKQVEQALKESEERYRNLVENINDAFFVSNAQGKLLYGSPNLFTETGYSPEEILGKLYVRLIAPDDRRRIVDFYLEQMRTGVLDAKCEFKGLRKNGSIVWVEQTSRIVRDSDGNVIEVRNVVRDIADRKCAEDALRASELRFRTVWEKGTDGMRITNEEGIVILLNDAYSKMVEKPREEIEGKPMSIVYEEAKQAEVLRKHQERFRSRNIPAYLERELVLWNGKRISLELSNTFIEIPHQPTLSLSVFRDITERKKLEKRQRDLELELLQNHKLSAIGQLTAGIVHNLNNPLATVQLAAQVMRKERETKEIEVILSECKRMKEIVSTVLRKGREETETEKRLFDLNEMARIELGFLEADPRLKHRIEKEYNFCGSPALMEGIYSDFSQSFNNIVRNAIDAMHASQTKKLTVATQTDESWIYIIVKDTGCGIPKENISKLFEPFFTSKPRLGEQKADEPTGTGLGLSSMHQLLSPYGAKFQIRSEVGKGTEFVVKLPRTLQTSAVSKK